MMLLSRTGKAPHFVALWSLLLFCSYYIGGCDGVVQGDEQYADIPGGRFWAFHSAGVSIVNAETCEVEHTIRADSQGRSLPEKWAHGVYMQKRGSKYSNNNTEEAGYIFVNSGVTNYDKYDQAIGEVVFLSTDPKVLSTTDSNQNSQAVQSRIAVDGGFSWHSNSYAVYTRNEFWMQSDGQLSIISLEDVEKSTKYEPFAVKVQTIQLGSEAPDEIRGELLWDESPFLAKHGYMSGRDMAIHIIDMEKKTQVRLFNYSSYLEDGECSLAYGLAFSNTNKHLYVDCHWRGPVLEFDVSAPLGPKFVAKHNISGWLYEEPNSGFIVAADRHRNLLHMLKPQLSGQSSSIEYQVQVPGRPDKASFLMEGPEKGVVCMPLTENVNRNNRDNNGNIACDQFSCGPPQTPQDVAAGMCLYDAADSNKTLLRAPLEDFEKVKNQEAPYFNRCPRCKQRESYYGGDVCTCTPHCGSCADPDYDVSQTGVRCFHLEDVLEGNSDQSTLIAGAGAIEQPGPSFWNAPCSFGWTHRSSRRGGKFYVTVAHFPSNSLQIVDMSTQQLKCQVGLEGKPDHILYVPPQPGQQASNKSNSSKNVVIFMTVAVCVMAFVATVLVVTLSHYDKGTTAASNDFTYTEDSEASALPEIA